MTHAEKQEKYNVTVAWSKLKKWIDGHQRAGYTHKEGGIEVFVNTKKSVATLARFKCVNPEQFKTPEKLVYRLVGAYAMVVYCTLVGVNRRLVLVGPKLQRNDIFKVMGETYSYYRKHNL